MLPFAALAGDPYEQGLMHGRAAAPRVRHNLDVYMRRFTVEAGLTREEVADRAAAYWRLIEHEAPDYAAGVRGIAHGSDVALEDVVVLNIRYEILYSRLTELLMAGQESAVSECTSFAVPSADGWLIGQNWDWIPDVQGLVVQIDGPIPVLAFTEAGIFGPKIGLNGAGIGLAVNGLASTGDDWERMGTPFHVRTWRALHASTLDAARHALEDGTHSCSANFMIAQADEGAIDLETSPSGACVWEADGGSIVHANHFTDPEAMGVVEPANPRRPFSIHRQARLAELLAGETVDAAGLQTLLRDHDGHPNSVCRHPDTSDASRPPYQTVTSAIMNLASRELWLTDGPPCGAEYQHFGL